MVGISLDVVFVDVWLKGIGGFDLVEVYVVVLKNVIVVFFDCYVGCKGMDCLIFCGYVSVDVYEGMLWMMEGVLNDFGIVNMVEVLVRCVIMLVVCECYSIEVDYFCYCVVSYVMMFDLVVGFFQGCKVDGQWCVDVRVYDLCVWGYDYIEFNGWIFVFIVVYDGEGFVVFYGGCDKLVVKLDIFFFMLEIVDFVFVGFYGGIIYEMIEVCDVCMGMYVYSNQLVYYILWMYLYVGQLWKIQQYVCEILLWLYVGSEIGQGYLGDEDNGEIFVWYVLVLLGLYLLCMGVLEYVIGLLVFEYVRVELQGGVVLIVNVVNNLCENVYVQLLKINGKLWMKIWVLYELIVKGVMLDFVMGLQLLCWGSGVDDVLCLLIVWGQCLQLLYDLFGSGVKVMLVDGCVLLVLVDDDVVIIVGLGGGVIIVLIGLGDGVLIMYMFISGDGCIQGGEWMLEVCSGNGCWMVIDQCSGEVFEFVCQI